MAVPHVTRRSKKAGADESGIIAAKLLLNLQGEKAVSWGLMVTTVCTLN